MSFKREGNDTNQLGILRKRRVRELLGIAVPEDEALLMSNGRFACLVCGHRPVFDTVDMLIVHRQGKKHLANAEYEAGKKDELKKLIEKRKHDQYVKNGSTVIHQAQTSCKGLGIGAPYDPRAKKPRPHERKQKLDFTGSVSQEPASTNLSALPGNRCSLSNQQRKNSNVEIDPRKRAYCPKDDDYKTDKKTLSNQSFRDLLLQQADNGPVKHSKQLKRIFMQEKSTEETNIGKYQPYVSNKSKRKFGNHSELSNNSTTVLPSQSTCPHENFKDSKFRSDEQFSKTFNGHSEISGHPGFRGGEIKNTCTSLKQSEILALAGNPPPPPPSNKLTSNEKQSIQPETASVSEERKRKAELYLQCRGAGWKKDLTGEMDSR
ncbi:uncharacterized protein LOC117336783 isoform X2 [Pecten maximus]|uniref:uncharacterized protein LOC117336783 isoform X2 n=1 Tax=Pecten maximus TaxID=6579 RepID=UPI0014590154|nr:uncharacterized protein LOC117336783 isoform X2 [Pecten maximus]